MIKEKRQRRSLRHQRVRGKIRGTAAQPRLSVFRSLKHICAQLINDTAGKTLASATSCGLKISKDNTLKGKLALAYETGLALAKAASKKKIKKVCFDRGGYKYHGRVKALADGARAGGLEF
jgi:large subunit ribosomal protein L18